MNRRNFIKGSAVFGGAMAALGPFQALRAECWAQRLERVKAMDHS